eukprot:5550032-Amphidinium_carterae.1
MHMHLYRISAACGLFIGLLVVLQSALPWKRHSTHYRSDSVRRLQSLTQRNLDLGLARNVTGRLPKQATLRNLHPKDVKVIAAVGDSISAGFAARGMVPLEFR